MIYRPQELGAGYRDISLRYKIGPVRTIRPVWDAGHPFLVPRLQIDAKCSILHLRSVCGTRPGEHMSYREIHGNIFNSSAEALVNTVNCVGAMGKGIALEFRRRFPTMFEEYQQLCERHLMRPGQIWPCKRSKPMVLNFAIKNDWHFPSRVEWIQECLTKFVANRDRLGITSVAFPWMGAMNGGIPIDTIKALMRQHLEDIPGLDVEVYDFDPDAADPLYRHLQSLVPRLSVKEFADAGHFAKRTANAIYGAMEGDPPSLYRLIEAADLGTGTADKLYALLLDPPAIAATNNLFTLL